MKPNHIYQGSCPDEWQPDASDPECPACRSAQADARDAARIDWIACNPGFSSCVVIDREHDGEYEVRVEHAEPGPRRRPTITYGKTFREAIDAAMAASKKEG